jgi:hypothetical protein
MNKKMSFKLRAVAALAMGALAVMVTAQVTRTIPKPEKICPITFQLYPDTPLEKNFAAKIERDNAVLSTFLGELRSMPGLLADVKSWIANPSRTPDPINEFYGLLKTKNAANPFPGTYLAEPSLTKENGETVTGLPAVIGELVRIVENSTYIDAQSVQVYLQYLPSNSTEYMDINRAHPDASRKGPIDIIAHIHTVLAYAPHDDPVRISGTQGHRTVCDPGY